MKFNNLSDALAVEKKHTITTLDLSNLKMKVFPPEIGVFYNLRVLNLNNNHFKELPAEIGQLRNLSTLKLNNNDLSQLPKEFTALTKLHRLELNGNQLIALPANFGALEKLNYLLLRNNLLSALPDDFSKLQQLKTLSIGYNQFETFPESVLQLSQLSSLAMNGNSFAKIPQEIFHLPNLREVTGLNKLKKISPKAIVAKFKGTYDKTDFPEELYVEFLHIFLARDDKVAALPSIRLFDALTIPEETLRKNALEYLFKQPQAKFAKKPLTNDSTLTFVGDTSLKKSEVREKLKNHGIGYSPKISKNTTHLVIGHNPQNYKGANKKKYVYLSEQQLNDFLNEIDTPYLLEQDNTQQHSIENLQHMLISTDIANMGVAVEILKGGGVPGELLTELFFTAKVARDKKIRERAKELVKLYGSKSMQKALNHKEKLGSGTTAYDAEKKVYKKLRKYATLSKDIQWGKVAYYHYLHYNHGLRFFFDYEPVGNELRKQVLKSLIQDNQLDFFKAYATYMPSYDAPYAYEYYQPKPFPSDLLEFTNLTSLNISGCYIEEIPQNITQLSRLQILDCSGNFISSLPENITQLGQLHTIDISNNEFKEFPVILAQMPQLKKVIFRTNRDKWEHFPLSIPQEMKKALPDCEFEISRY